MRDADARELLNILGRLDKTCNSISQAIRVTAISTDFKDMLEVHKDYQVRLREIIVEIGLINESINLVSDSVERSINSASDTIGVIIDNSSGDLKDEIEKGSNKISRAIEEKERLIGNLLYFVSGMVVGALILLVIIWLKGL